MKKLLYIFFILLFVPFASSAKLTQPQKNLTIDYTVQNGDTLYKIAHEHHTSIKEVLEANGMSQNAVIKVGQVIKVPLNTYRPPKNTKTSTLHETFANTGSNANLNGEYRVKHGDTLFTIARAHHTSISALLKANKLELNTVIKVGQVLVIPDSGNSAVQAPKQESVIAQSVSKISKNNLYGDKDIYIIQPGDTLFSIARKNHIIISKLMAINHIGLGDELRVGDKIRLTPAKNTYIAGKDMDAPQKAQKKKELPLGAMPSYIVKKGDTLWEIARKHHLTLAEIRKLNKMSKKDQIHTGMVLAVGKPVEPKPKTYKVKKGDTLWLIAKKYNMSIKELRKLNNLSRKQSIHKGMVLALSKDATVPKVRESKTDSQKAVMIARLKKKGAKKSEIEAVLARVKKSKKKNPDIEAMLAQIKKEKKKKQIDTPLRIAKKKKKSKQSRFSSAASILKSGRSSRSYRGDSRVIRVAKRYLGRRYVWGAEGPRAFDCSGFTQYVMRKTKGITIPRVSRKQAYYGKYVSRSHLRPGDLVFFDTSRRRRGYVNHVGIYIGNNKFIHASSAKHRVVITSLDRPFYRARFKWGRRIN